MNSFLANHTAKIAINQPFLKWAGSGIRGVFVPALLAVLCACVLFARAAAASSALGYAEDGPGVFGIDDFNVKYELDAGVEGRIYRLRLDENVFRNLRQSY